MDNQNIMQNFWDSRMLIPYHPLACLGDFLFKFSEPAEFPFSVKSVEHGTSIKDMKVISVCF
jgi:hypothetical protein